MEQTERNLVKQATQLNTRKEFLAREQRCNDFIESLEGQSSIKRPRLPIGVRQSLTARIARLESLKDSVRGRFMQVGTGHSAGLRWREIDTAFESRILTDAVINSGHIEPREFLEDAREIMLEHVQIVTQRQIHNTFRTDETFKNRSQPEHHTGDSILEKLPIEMVSQIPLDYMHLVCLGVTKRLLQIWQSGSKNFRLSKECVNFVSRYLMVIKPYIPLEFARKPRVIQDIDRWKATELRQFLLYTGIVVMKSILSPICYDHFLCLSVAIRILIDPQLCVTSNDYANLLLLYFVSNYGNIYGEEYLSYNVHNLIHLTKDVDNFGSLDNFSCFKYENYMQKIKKKLHQSGKPLEELANRIFEEFKLAIQPCHMKKYPIVIYRKNNEISYLHK
ncbi:hypothetical protein ALC57_05315 [Trachymyrmex cornetzi]|uniref:DUF4218 domain-containing protein n=1 Tax=Trachymyrmex cornetzi TaxID=471704 RepID=A0A151JBA3_9HYME|nr:hypothetical protein ALC57_05315 [Trachymyrmex cornetzi]